MIEEGTRLRVLVFDDDTDIVDSTALLFQMRIARDDLWRIRRRNPTMRLVPRCCARFRFRRRTADR